MRGIKILGYIVGGLVLLVILLLVGVWLFVNPSNYKGRITQEVRTATGRELSLPGDIKLSVFPWIALELGPASLGNPPGFGSEPFVSVKHVALRVKLLPLLHGQLEVGRVQVDGMDLRMKKNAAGKGNWEDFGEKKGQAPAQKSEGGLQGFRELAGVLVKDSRISYESNTLSEVNLDIGRVAMKTPVPVKLSFNLDRGPQAAALSFTGALNATLDPDNKRYGIAALNLNGDLKNPGDSRPIAWRFSASQLDVDLGAQTLHAPAFTAQYAAAQLSGVLNGEKIIDAPALDGSLKLEPVVLRELLPRVGIELPKTRDPQVLSKLAAAMQFAYGGNAATLKGLNLVLDDSKFTGDAAITNLDTKAMKFDLNLDQIDVDRYLSPDEAGAKGDEKPVDLPAEKLKPLDANGTFRIGRLRVAGMDLTNVSLTLQAKDGLMHLAPLKAQVSREQNLADVVAAYDHLAANVDVDAGRIAVGGSSYGGYLAAILTSLRPVRWLALRAPALYQDEGWLTPKLQLHTQSLAEYRRRPVTPKENRALAACAEYEGDVLVVESEHDEIIPPASVASYRAACQQAHSLTYRVMRGADHGLTAPAAQREYTQLFCGWISELAFAERAEKKTPEHVAPEPETAPPEIRP